MKSTLPVTHSKLIFCVRRLLLSSAFAVSLGAGFTGTAYAQSEQPVSMPAMIGEGGTLGTQQGISTGLSFLIYTPTAQSSTPNLATKSPTTYGVTDALNLLNPGQANGKALSLNGAALFADPTKVGKQQSQKEAIDQTISYNQGPAKFSLGFTDVGKLFAADGSSSSSLAPSIAQDLAGKKGQTGFNTGFDFNQSGTKIGLTFSSIADAVQSQHRLSESLSLERDFDKALSMSFERTQNNSEQLTSSAASHVTNDIVHLAYSPTRTGFLLDGTSKETLADNGSRSNDLLLKVAQHFAALNMSSQFESASSTASPGTSDWTSQRFDASDTVRRGLVFSGYWAKKAVPNGTGTNDFDVIMKSNESRFLQLAAEYAKTSPTAGLGTSKQSLVATVSPGLVGPLGALLLTLSINIQQTPCLDGFQSYEATVSGQIAPHSGFDLGMAGAKYYLAFAEASEGGPSTNTGQRVTHSARTLRLVSAPAGKNGLSWTVSQQQRLDQNGQPLQTASDYEAKYNLNSRVSLAATSTFAAAKPDGSFSDQDQQVISLAYDQNHSDAMIAQYVHTRCPSQNISAEDGVMLTYSAKMPNANKMDLGLGAQTKSDSNGKDAFGATANLAYGWKSDSANLVAISSKLTDWNNQGFNNDFNSSIEAAGQINFQRLF